MFYDQFDNLVRILIGDEPAGDLRVRLARRHGLRPRPLIAAPHAVELERRPRPLALERRVARLADARRRADLREVRRLVERQIVDRLPLGGGELAHAIVEVRDGDASVGLVQRRDELGHRVQRIRHRAAVPPRMQILRRAGERELEAGESAARHGERRLVDPPHRAVRRDDEVRREELLVVADERVEARAADLLLALEHALDVERQRAGDGEERLGDFDRDEHRPLVVRHAARVEAPVALGGRERRAMPLL